MVPPFKLFFFILATACLSSFCSHPTKNTFNIPLPEHPRPDFERADWRNLNGSWQFEFDSANVGEREKWYADNTTFSKQIMVPFPWGSPLSKVENKADIGWYQRQITLPKSWKNKRIFLVVGAADWHTKGWIDGQPIGQYQGGYTPFEFELTHQANFEQPQTITLRVDDTPHDFKRYGKQGYGDARGIWQTVYLEARPDNFIKRFYFTPDIDRELLAVRVLLDRPTNHDTRLLLNYSDERESYSIGETTIKKGQKSMTFAVDIPKPHLWSLEDPYLYFSQLILAKDHPDTVNTYFAMRKIGVTTLPGTDISYVALNNKPIYLQTTLDQAFHPKGYYTFPSDEFIRDEIWRAKSIGLNGQRVHVKVAIPRKLYWADRLGHLIMADVPNSWGQPDADMQHETMTALQGMIDRDYNHPCIYAWVLFNETWGLQTKDASGKRSYTKETQEWVRSMYHIAKKLDSTRLVEDNSANRRDHVITDLNSWHAYLPGYAWKDMLDHVSEQTFVGSAWNYAEGKVQTNAPMINSECGNVWGYRGSTGDVDWSWDYHIMINEFRRHPKVAGWLYTEHHDVINEWNGYWRYDRSRKFTGLEALVPGMKINDLHSDIYLAPAGDLCREAQPGEKLSIPVRLSVMTDRVPTDSALLSMYLYGWNTVGDTVNSPVVSQKITLSPWEQQDLPPLKATMPAQAGLYILSMQLTSSQGKKLHTNFVTFRVKGGKSPKNIISFAPSSFSDSQWSLKQWNIMEGLKVNGAGHGYFEYEVFIPKTMDLEAFSGAEIRAELSSKPLNGKDKPRADQLSHDYMRGKGMHDPSQNPNSYPMTDEHEHPSLVTVRVNGEILREINLKDDPADHRGILSWHAQPHDRTLHEAGTYGYLVKLPIDKNLFSKVRRDGKFIIRFEVDQTSDGGLAIYGKDFGRYPFNPTILLE